jgi:DNA-binding Lrp family transcriptional regulator
MALDGFDELDRRIIKLMSTSSQGSYRQIAKVLDVHPSTLIQRIKNLESRGVIRGYRANVDYMKLGFEFMGVVNVSASDVVAVQDAIAGIPQVVSVFDVTGDSDCMAWIACVDREEFSSVVKRINSIEGVTRTNTSVIMDIKKDPFEYVPPILRRRARAKRPGPLRCRPCFYSGSRIASAIHRCSYEKNEHMRRPEAVRHR